MGARGNSGVITSQILRGVAEGLVGANNVNATPADVATALRNGVKVAFKAVRKPVEGTILTVLRDVSARADQLEKSRITMTEMLDALVVEAYESLPDLNVEKILSSGTPAGADRFREQGAWILAVQFHPEAFTQAGDPTFLRIFQDLVRRAAPRRPAR